MTLTNKGLSKVEIAKKLVQVEITRDGTPMGKKGTVVALTETVANKVVKVMCYGKYVGGKPKDIDTSEKESNKQMTGKDKKEDKKKK